MRLGVSTKSLYTWIAQFSKPQFSKPQFSKPQWQTDQEAEVRRLKKELARVMELPRSHSSLPGRRTVSDHIETHSSELIVTTGELHTVLIFV